MRCMPIPVCCPMATERRIWLCLTVFAPKTMRNKGYLTGPFDSTATSNAIVESWNGRIAQLTKHTTDSQSRQILSYSHTNQPCETRFDCFVVAITRTMVNVIPRR